jgi:hypothetical protein
MDGWTWDVTKWFFVAVGGQKLSCFVRDMENMGNDIAGLG